MTPFGELEVSLSPEVSAILVEWVQTFADGDTSRRDALWERALALDPTNAIRATAAAMRTLDDALGPDSGEALLDLGGEAFTHGDVEGALSMWAEAAAEGNGRALLNLYAVSRDSGDAAGQLHWEQAIRRAQDPGLLWSIANDYLARGDHAAYLRWCHEAAEAGDSRANHQLAADEIDGGRLEEGLTRLDPFARAGDPSIISTCIWSLLADGQFERAQRFGREVMPAAELFVQRLAADPDGAAWAEQLANARSNLALAGLALGGDAQRAVSTWQQGALTGHPESRFYPLVIRWRNGDTDGAAAEYRELPEEVRASIDETLDQLSSHSGWLTEWAHICRSFVEQAQQPRSHLSPRVQSGTPDLDRVHRLAVSGDSSGAQDALRLMESAGVPGLSEAALDLAFRVYLTDDKRAGAILLEAAAVLGSTPAEDAGRAAYYAGVGWDSLDDRSLAVHCWRLAAGFGSTDAMYMLGLVLEGPEQVAYLQRAADAGHPRARSFLDQLR